MQGWSWMAALTLAAASAATFGPASLAGQPTPTRQVVKLSLRVDGIARQDGEILIKPGHPGCRFKEITTRVSDLVPDMYGMYNFAPFEVETVSADRDCSFAITLREPGKPDKTARRNLRIIPNAEGRPAAPQILRCYVSSGPTAPVAGKADDSTRKK